MIQKICRHNTVSVKGIIKNQGFILVVKDKQGNFDLPGGRSNCGEELTHTLRRELSEEIGVLTCSIADTPHFVFSWSNDERKTHGVVICFDVTLGTYDNLNISDENIVSFEWVTPAKLLELPMPRKWKEVYANFLK